MTRTVTTQQNVPSQRRTETPQKTSDSLGNSALKGLTWTVPQRLLSKIPCIYEVNAIHPTFAKEQSLPIRPIDVGAQKINGTTLDTYEVVVAAFSVTDKTNRVRFFE